MASVGMLWRYHTSALTVAQAMRLYSNDYLLDIDEFQRLGPLESISNRGVILIPAVQRLCINGQRVARPIRGRLSALITVLPSTHISHLWDTPKVEDYT